MTLKKAVSVPETDVTKQLSFSIIVCTYNRASSLQRTLEMLNASDIPTDVPTDLIVVNNNSADNTPGICQEFEKKSRLPVTYCMEVKQGLSHARNRGLGEAKGSVVIFTDDDIAVPKDWVTSYVSTYRRHAADAVFGRIIPDWQGQRPPWLHDKFSAIYGALDYGSDEMIVTTRRHEFFGANFSIRRQLLNELGGFDPRLGRTPEGLYISEERKIFLALVAQQRKIIYNPEIFVLHNISEAMKTRAYIKKYYRDTAVSLVNMSPMNSNRQLFGIPYYRIVECSRSLLLFVPRMIGAALRSDFKVLFPLRMELMRNLRVCLLHMQHWRAGQE